MKEKEYAKEFKHWRTNLHSNTIKIDAKLNLNT